MRNLAIGVAILSILPLLAEGAEVRHVKWENLLMVQGKTVRVFLAEGFVTGKVSAVESDALAVDVKKTSDSKTYPRGVLRVPREKLHQLEMQTKGRTGRIVTKALSSKGWPPPWRSCRPAISSSARRAWRPNSVPACLI